MSKTTPKQVLSFVLTVIALISLATAVILFAEQYTIKDGKIIQAGMIEIKDIRGAKIFLDGEEKGTTPATLTYLEEGTYKIELKKDGYITWQKEVRVRAGKVATIFPILVSSSLEADPLFDVIATYPTESPQAYLSLVEEGEKLILRKHTIEKRLFDTSVSVTVLADLKELAEDNAESEQILDGIEIYPSPTGKRVLIANETKNKYYLAEEQKQGPENISDWISLPLEKFYWTSNENYGVVMSNSLLVALNLKNGQNVIVNNAGDSSYTAVAPLKNRLLFGLEQAQTAENKLFQVDIDGSNKIELAEPEDGWQRISKIVEMEDQGILIVETEDGIYQLTSASAEPELIAKKGVIAGTDIENQLIAVCNGGGDESHGEGKVYFFGQVSLFPFVEINYPSGCKNIANLQFVNSGQNIFVTLASGSLIMSTEDGTNCVELDSYIQKQTGNADSSTGSQLLGYSYHRQNLLIHLETSGTVYRLSID